MGGILFIQSLLLIIIDDFIFNYIKVDMTLLKKGVSVLICSHNGERNLESTLRHLAAQRTEDDLLWEILLINNASTDNTANTAREIWSGFNCAVSLRVMDEMNPGKDKAVELGLRHVNYRYVIICDDDNWLADDYVQRAMEIMEGDGAIGLLGGRGIAVAECPLPPWFSEFATYYAVGKQYAFSGEIKHYWPEYRFLWGAGAVINMQAYEQLQRSGFSRILTLEKAGKVARSENLELCFAIWLAGYKIMYDKRLSYQHFIAADRLRWPYLMNLIRLSVTAMHYLRPYNILIFTGDANAPKSSFWKQYIKHYCKLAMSHFRTWKDLKILMRILLRVHQENSYYLNKAIVWYQLTSVLRLGKKYDSLYKQVWALQRKLTGQPKPVGLLNEVADI